MRPSRFILAALLPVCLTPALQAQEYATDRGSAMLGGSASITSHWRNSARTTRISVSPTGQFFVVPNLAVGGILEVHHERLSGDSYTLYGAGPTASYFFAAPHATTLPYVSANTSVHFRHGQDIGLFTYGGSAGVVFMISRNVGIDASLFYRGERTTGRTVFPWSSNSIGLELGFAAFTF